MQEYTQNTKSTWELTSLKHLLSIFFLFKGHCQHEKFAKIKIFWLNFVKSRRYPISLPYVTQIYDLIG